MKRIALAFALAIVVLFTSISAFADHPVSISIYDAGNATNLISIKKPETAISATSKKIYGISGISSQGVTVAIYKYSSLSGEYVLMKNKDGTNTITTIGASGLYIKQVTLNEGENKFLIRAESPNGSYQIVKFEISLLTQETADSLRTFDFSSVFSGWLN